MVWNDQYKQKNFTPSYLKSYETVADRIKLMKKTYPDSVVITELKTDIKEIKDHVVFIAKIYKDKKNMTTPDAVGHSLSIAGGIEKMPSKFDKPEDGPKIQSAGDFSSWVENCETSAVGRALAFLGFINKKDIASDDEMNQKDQNEAAINSLVEEEKKAEPVKKTNSIQESIKERAAQIIKNNKSILEPKTNKEEVENILK